MMDRRALYILSAALVLAGLLALLGAMKNGKSIDRLASLAERLGVDAEDLKA